MWVSKAPYNSWVFPHWRSHDFIPNSRWESCFGFQPTDHGFLSTAVCCTHVPTTKDKTRPWYTAVTQGHFIQNTEGAISLGQHITWAPYSCHKTTHYTCLQWVASLQYWITAIKTNSCQNIKTFQSKSYSSWRTVRYKAFQLQPRGLPDRCTRSNTPCLCRLLSDKG